MNKDIHMHTRIYEGVFMYIRLIRVQRLRG